MKTVIAPDEHILIKKFDLPGADGCGVDRKRISGNLSGGVMLRMPTPNPGCRAHLVAPTRRKDDCSQRGWQTEPRPGYSGHDVGRRKLVLDARRRQGSRPKAMGNPTFIEWEPTCQWAEPVPAENAHAVMVGRPPSMVAAPVTGMMEPHRRWRAVRPGSSLMALAFVGQRNEQDDAAQAWYRAALGVVIVTICMTPTGRNWPFTRR